MTTKHEYLMIYKFTHADVVFVAINYFLDPDKICYHKQFAIWHMATNTRVLQVPWMIEKMQGKHFSLQQTIVIKAINVQLRKATGKTSV